MHFSSTSAASIGKTLGRTKVAVLNYARNHGYGRQIDANGEMLNIGMINRAFGKRTVAHITADYMERTGLKVRRLRLGRVTRYLVGIDDFWDWLEMNQSHYPPTRLEPMALGPEPEWMAEARIRARKYPLTNGRLRWTDQDDMMLMSMARQQRPIREICTALKRSENAVRQRAAMNWAVDLSYTREPTRRRWTPEEEQTLVDMAQAGCRSAEIAKRIGRTERMVRMRLKELCGTSSLEKAMKAAAEEEGKRGKGKRAKRGSAGRARNTGRAGNGGKREAG